VGGSPSRSLTSAGTCARPGEVGRAVVGWLEDDDTDVAGDPGLEALPVPRLRDDGGHTCASCWPEAVRAVIGAIMALRWPRAARLVTRFAIPAGRPIAAAGSGDHDLRSPHGRQPSTLWALTPGLRPELVRTHRSIAPLRPRPCLGGPDHGDAPICEGPWPQASSGGRGAGRRQGGRVLFSSIGQ
jgi:hypothetical protein